jgi:glutathione peroxidase
LSPAIAREAWRDGRVACQTRFVRLAFASTVLAALAAVAACTSSSSDAPAPSSGTTTTPPPASTPKPRDPPPPDTDAGTCTGEVGSLYALGVPALGGKEDVPLCRYSGKVLLVVNTASFCGYTPQLTPLQALYEKYEPKGLVVLGFPSKSFNQEYDADTDVSTVCTNTYHITFPMFTIAPVTPGPDQQPVYKWLNAQPGYETAVAWNFEKFLISRQGKIAKRFLTAVTPDSADVTSAIEAELAK